MWPITGISASTMRLDHADALGAALELHALGTGTDQLGGVADRVGRRHVVAHPRHVTDDQRGGLGPSDRGDVVRHVGSTVTWSVSS
jgi:hypothetical protein